MITCLAPIITFLTDVSDDEPRVVLTECWTERPLYATLSHCWGKVPFLQLYRHNFLWFLIAIPTEHLPKTFKDALYTTKSLGLRYIWIDSLCIIQDDDSDWQREAFRVSSVYGGSHVNIAASSFSGAHEGFLGHPFPLDSLRARVAHKITSYSVSTVLQLEPYRKRTWMQSGVHIWLLELGLFRRKSSPRAPSTHWHTRFVLGVWNEIGERRITRRTSWRLSRRLRDRSAV